MRLTGTLVLVLGVLVFAGGAYAGNGNGNSNGNEGAAPGNSASAPGQVKKDAPAAAPETTTTNTTTTVTTQTTTSAPAPANATGVKPSNDTAHDTHAEAQSDQTKQYGNGQTAGQVAEKNGAKGDTVLHGPGNSQPHKAAPCSGGHEVDVHALKSHRSGSCDDPGSHPQPGPTPVPGPNSHPSSGPPVLTTTPSSSVTTTKDPSQWDPGSKPAQGQSSAENAGSTEGVLSKTQGVGHPATLPFTGQRLWLAVLLGVLLIVTGLALREIRTAEASVESGHDHTDRSRHAARSSRATGGGRSGR